MRKSDIQPQVGLDAITPYRTTGGGFYAALSWTCALSQAAISASLQKRRRAR